MTVSLKLLYWGCLCLLTVVVFLFVVLVRITTPRFKLETLSKLSWGASLAIIGASVAVYALGFALA